MTLKNTLAFINVQATDQNGLKVPADNAFSLFRGNGLVIVRSTGEPGTISVEVSSEDLKSASVSLEAR